jgi:hypothetical protein
MESQGRELAGSSESRVHSMGSLHRRGKEMIHGEL